jgi:hypothetical protein
VFLRNPRHIPLRSKSFCQILKQKLVPLNRAHIHGKLGVTDKPMERNFKLRFSVYVCNLVFPKILILLKRCFNKDLDRSPRVVSNYNLRLQRNLFLIAFHGDINDYSATHLKLI